MRGTEPRYTIQVAAESRKEVIHDISWSMIVFRIDRRCSQSRPLGEISGNGFSEEMALQDGKRTSFYLNLAG